MTITDHEEREKGSTMQKRIALIVLAAAGYGIDGASDNPCNEEACQAR